MSEHSNPDKKEETMKRDMTTIETFFYVNLSELTFSISTAINSYSTSSLGISVFEFSLARSFCNFLVSAAILFLKRTSPLQGVEKDMLLPLAVRCIFGNIAFMSLTYVFKILPLAIGTVIISTAPFAVAVLSRLILAENIASVDIIAIIVSFTGIAIMTFGAPA
jgi:drug/metabolite transporter (DMT)-like permease